MVQGATMSLASSNASLALNHARIYGAVKKADSALRVSNHFVCGPKKFLLDSKLMDLQRPIVPGYRSIHLFALTSCLSQLALLTRRTRGVGW